MKLKLRVVVAAEMFRPRSDGLWLRESMALSLEDLRRVRDGDLNYISRE